MERVFIKKHWQIILINFLIILAFILGYGRFGDIIFDSFREAYIPAQIIKGQVLYKNIFNIYAPFSYLFNALLFKIFGVRLSVLYFAGLFTTISITNFIYIISNKFFDKNYSFAFSLFFICAAVLSGNVFNCFFPYSYGMLYGLLFILASLYFALNKKYTPAFLMYSFAICSKYEFLLLLPLLFYAAGKKNLWKNILALILPVIITYFPLLIQGAGLKNLITSYQLTMAMSATKTLYWFYSVTGLVFRPELIPIYLENIIKFVIPAAAAYYIKNWIIYPFILAYCYFIFTPEIFIYIFPLILILFIGRFTELSNKTRFFVAASLLISAKIFFALTLLSYGIYFIPFALISIFILLPKRIQNPALAVLILCGISFGIKNIQTLYSKNVKITSKQGTIYTIPYNGNSIKQLVEYINTNTKPEAKVLVYPECLGINILTNRDSDNKFYSLIPLYVETFGEEVIIKRLEIKQPEYIVISNYDTSIYYYSYFGKDYAAKIMDFIHQNYDKQTDIGEGLIFTVYKLKSHHPSQQHA